MRRESDKPKKAFWVQNITNTNRTVETKTTRENHGIRKNNNNRP
jgi:hypothetical protein